MRLWNFLILVYPSRAEKAFILANAIEQFPFGETLLPWLVGVNYCRVTDDTALSTGVAWHLLVAFALSSLAFQAREALVLTLLRGARRWAALLSGR